MYTNSGVQAYRETDINSMTREKMIVLLYEKIVSDLNEVQAAIERDDRITMTMRTNHSQRIISELRNALDHAIGGDISRNLEALYDYMFHQHLEMLVDQDPLHAKNCIRVITPLLDAWRKVPVGTGEQAARDHARGLLQAPGGPNPASDGHGGRTGSPQQDPAIARDASSEAPNTDIGTKQSELVSVSA
ncbi:MAG: flagellar export chaperone FliS [Gammaproteobacteria bacterium]|nr:MAG: flagellar export chaperone FliS [Gammaproteobacteria bacterium]